MFLISTTLLYLPTIPSCMSAVGEETSEPGTSYSLPWKDFCYSSPSHLTPETFVSPSTLCIYFVFFVFVFCPIETTAKNLQGLTHWNRSKSTNQVTLSNEHINHLFWAQGNLVHCRINPYFPLLIFCWRKEERAFHSSVTVAFTLWNCQK